MAALDRLLKLASERRIPVVLGDIPELLPERQIQRTKLNSEIWKRCAPANGCHLLELDRLHKQVMRDRHLTIKGKRYSFPELVPDGLHLADVAGEFLADYIFQLPLFQPR